MLNMSIKVVYREKFVVFASIINAEFWLLILFETSTKYRNTNSKWWKYLNKLKEFNDFNP